MPVVTETIEGPDGTPLQYVDVTVRLIASTSGEAAGYVSAGDITVLGRWSTRTAANGVASLTLIANALIAPTGTVYEWTRKAPGRPPVTDYISVPNGAGPYVVEDILTTAPDSLPSPPLSAHMADTTDAHVASAVTFTPVGAIAATDVQGAIEELESGYAREIGYVEITTDETITATSDTDVSSFTVTVTVGTRPIEVIATAILTNDTAGASTTFKVKEGATEIVRMAKEAQIAANNLCARTTRRRLTPTAGDHTYKVTAAVSSGNGHIRADVNPASVQVFEL